MGMAICPEWTDTHCRSIPADRDGACQTSAAADLPDGRRQDNTEIWGWCLAGILHHEIRAIGCAPYHGYFQCGLNGEQKCIEGSTQRFIKPLLATETGKWTSSVASILLLVLLGVLFPRLLELLLVTTARARRGRGLLGLPQLLAGRVERRVIRVVGVLRRGGGRRVVVLGRGLRVGAMPVVGVRVVCAVVSVSLPWGMMIEGQHTQSTCEHRTADQTGAGSHSHAAVPR